MSLDYVTFKHNLKKLHSESEVKKIIMEKIQEIPDFINLKFDPEMCLFVCNLIENAVRDKKISKIDKKAFVKDVLNNLFHYNNDELKQVDTLIEFLHSNKKIKTVNVTKKLGTYLFKWVEKKLL